MPVVEGIYTIKNLEKGIFIDLSNDDYKTLIGYTANHSDSQKVYAYIFLRIYASNSEIEFAIVANHIPRGGLFHL
jgi:hypothetical protein